MLGQRATVSLTGTAVLCIVIPHKSDSIFSVVCGLSRRVRWCLHPRSSSYIGIILGRGRRSLCVDGRGHGRGGGGGLLGFGIDAAKEIIVSTLHAACTLPDLWAIGTRRLASSAVLLRGLRWGEGVRSSAYRYSYWGDCVFVGNCASVVVVAGVLVGCTLGGLSGQKLAAEFL